VATLLVLAVLLLGCGSSSASSQRLPDATDQPPAAANPVPAPSGLLGPGKLTVAILPTLPVQQYLDHEQKPAGFDIDLVNAIGSQLGLRVGFNKVQSEDEIVPGLAAQNRSYDMGMGDQVAAPALVSSARTVEYFSTGQSVLVPASDTSSAGLDSLCGATVGALRSSQGEVEVLRQNQQGCNNQRIHYRAYDDGTKAIQDILSGSVAAFVDEYSTSVYFARVYGRLRVVPKKLASKSEVMVFSIGDAALHDAVATALDRLQKDGTYAALLKRWGLEEGAVTSPLASPAPSPSPSPRKK
jgi:polar amino acid transport system substrate-binding protein